jgi:hypothetical protein
MPLRHPRSLRELGSRFFGDSHKQLLALCLDEEALAGTFHVGSSTNSSLAGPIAWIIHDLSGEKRKDALKG